MPLDHTQYQINEEAEKLVDAIDLVFSMAEVMMPPMGWTKEEINEIFIRTALKVNERRGIRRR